MKKSLLLAGSIVCVCPVLAQQKSNIVLILADDMRGTTIESLGKEDVLTPVLNTLSEECTVFTNAHIMGGTSAAVSMPSRAMLMTGKYLHNLEKQGAVIPESHTLIGEVLRNAGYHTFHTGKWHNGKASFNRCFSGGKDIFFGGMADHWNVPLFSYDRSGEYKNTRRIIQHPQHTNQPDIKDGEYVYSGKHSTDIFTEAAVEFIHSRKEQNQPFFLSLCYMSPHDPRSMPDEFMELYDTDRIALPPNFMKEHPFDNGELSIRDEVLAALPRVESEVKRHIAEYYAMISHLDAQIGNVIAALKACGLYENTIIVFAADNGLAVGQHGLLGKQNLYEHSVGVPLMIKNAGENPTHTTTDQLCYLIDLFPTLCQWMGQPVPDSVDGISLMPVLTANKPVRNYLYYGYRDCQRAVSNGEWKLISYNVNGVKTLQLFNLKDDPYETQNLIQDKKHQKIIAELNKQMSLLRNETGDVSSSFWD